MRLEPTARWRTADIELFLLEPAHASEAYVGWMNDPEVHRYLESRFVAQTLESVRDFIAAQLASPNTVFFGIRALEPRRHVGNIKIGPIDRPHGRGEVGIMIGDRAAWGRGVGSAAIGRVVDIARAELGLRMLTAGCYGGNGGSERAFAKAGFGRDGVRAGYYLLDGRAEDLVLMSKLL